MKTYTNIEVIEEIARSPDSVKWVKYEEEGLAIKQALKSPKLKAKFKQASEVLSKRQEEEPQLPEVKELELIRAGSVESFHSKAVQSIWNKVDELIERVNLLSSKK